MANGIIDTPPKSGPKISDLRPDRNAIRVPRPFFSGPENRLVESALSSVLAEGPEIYNPLVLHGPSGTGKSHLVRGLIGQWKQQNSRRRAVYATAVDFSRELKDAIDTNAVDEFRRRYRRAALLVLEDIGELRRRKTAQEEILTTIDALLAADRQIVVTTSVHPAQETEFVPALRGRLVSGLTVPVAPPSRATRYEILGSLGDIQKISLVDPVLRILAEGIEGTFSELDGALTQLAVTARHNGHTIDAATARHFVAQRRSSRQPSLRDIAVATARFFSLKLSDLQSSSRRRAVVTARGVAMFLARHLTQQSLEQIGCYLGGRDHTTVLHGCRKTESLLKTDPAIREAVEQLRRRWQPI